MLVWILLVLVGTVLYLRLWHHTGKFLARHKVSGRRPGFDGWLCFGSVSSIIGFGWSGIVSALADVTGFVDYAAGLSPAGQFLSVAGLSIIAAATAGAPTAFRAKEARDNALALRSGW